MEKAFLFFLTNPIPIKQKSFLANQISDLTRFNQFRFKINVSLKTFFFFFKRKENYFELKLFVTLLNFLTDLG
jgi:hypothetical protein